MAFPSTPLEVVQFQIMRHTDRNPTSTEAIGAIMSVATERLGDDRGAFVESLHRSLDPEVPGGLGTKNALRLQQLGDLILTEDEGVVRTERMGAISLLGALASVYDHRLHESNYSPATRDLPLYRAQTASFLARNLLVEVGFRATNDMKEYRLLAKAFLDYQAVDSTQNLGIELALCGLIADEAVVEETEEEEICDNSSETAMGSSISEARPIDLRPLGVTASRLFAAMDWIELPPQASLEARDVLHDGEAVAVLIDLTPCNSTLNKAMQDLLASRIGEKFWERMAQEVVRFNLGSPGARLPVGLEKVPTFYLRNRGYNETILRAYYVAMGETLQGLPLIGLVGAARSKQRQQAILRVIGKVGKLS